MGCTLLGVLSFTTGDCIRSLQDVPLMKLQLHLSISYSHSSAPGWLSAPFSMDMLIPLQYVYSLLYIQHYSLNEKHYIHNVCIYVHSALSHTCRWQAPSINPQPKREGLMTLSDMSGMQRDQPPTNETAAKECHTPQYTSLECTQRHTTTFLT